MPGVWPKPPSFTAEVPLVPASLDCVPGLTVEACGRSGLAVCGEATELVVARAGDMEDIGRVLLAILCTGWAPSVAGRLRATV